MSNFTVGQKVRAKAPIYEPADEYAPGGYLCKTHDVLIVREVNARHVYPIKVSHEHITDRSFGAMPDELEPLPDGVAPCDAMPDKIEAPSTDASETVSAIYRALSRGNNLQAQRLAAHYLDAKHERARNAGVSLADYQSESHQTPIPSPMDYEGEG